jgi:hypothetical protein
VTFFSISSIETSITAQEFSNSIFGPIFNPSYIYIVFFFHFYDFQAFFLYRTRN